MGVPVLFEVADERRAEVTVRLLAAEGRHVLPEEVERLGADAQGAPVARGVHEARARQRLDAPAGFEDFFRELDGLGGAIAADPEELARLNARYGLEMRPETVPELLDRFGLQLGERLAGGWRP